MHNKQRFLRCKLQQTETFVIFGHLLPFYPTNKPKNQHFEKVKKSPGDIIILLLSTMTDNHDVWFLRHGVQQVKSFLILDFFFALLLKNKNFGVGDIIRLHLCTTNGNHMIYGSLDIKCNGQSFLRTIFCPFDYRPPLSSKNLENQNFDKMKKKQKKNLEILSFVP